MPQRRVTVASSVGLHARPAALFTQAAAKAPVPVTIAKPDEEPVDAKSILMVLTLGVGHGEEVVLSAEGDGAEAALEELVALLEQDLDAPESSDAPAGAEMASSTTSELRGLGVSPGSASGPIARLGLPPRPPADERPGDDPQVELGRVARALDKVAATLEERAGQASAEASAVLGATALMARDPGLASSVKALLEKGQATTHALDAAVEGFCDVLAAAGGYMAERVTDLRDVRDRALAILLDEPMPGVPHPGHPYVLVGQDLSPADTATLDPSEVLAIVTELGGPTSHTAILAKGLGLPAVVQLSGAMELEEGTTVIVDGSSGVVLVNPDVATVTDAQARAEARRQLTASGVGGPGTTADGFAVQLLVNIATVEDAQRAGPVDSEGVGLFRTEGLYLGRRSAPSVAEQEATYRQVFGAFAGRKIVVRTLDAGADKPLAFVEMGEEENPALGVRGYRVSRREPQLLTTQLEALGRAAAASEATVWVMAPMISTPAEAKAFATLARSHGLATAGVMIEVPAAALRATSLFEHVDFVSLGTNDLAQYTFAADRMQGELADLLDPWQPALLDLIALTGSAGQDAGKPVGVCGEAGGDPLLACVLVGLGVRSLSMAPGLVATVRMVLRAHTLERCRAMAEAARGARDAESAREVVRAMAAESVRALL